MRTVRLVFSQGRQNVPWTATHFVAFGRQCVQGATKCAVKGAHFVVGDKLCRGDKMCRNTPWPEAIEAELTWIRMELPVDISWTTKYELLRRKRWEGPTQVWMCVCMELKKNVSAPNWLSVWKLYFTVYIRMCSMYSIYMCIQLFSAKDINVVGLNTKKVCLLLFKYAKRGYKSSDI